MEKERKTTTSWSTLFKSLLTWLSVCVFSSNFPPSFYFPSYFIAGTTSLSQPEGPAELVPRIRFTTILSRDKRDILSSSHLFSVIFQAHFSYFTRLFLLFFFFCKWLNTRTRSSIVDYGGWPCERNKKKKNSFPQKCVTPKGSHSLNLFSGSSVGQPRGLAIVAHRHRSPNESRTERLFVVALPPTNLAAIIIVMREKRKRKMRPRTLSALLFLSSRIIKSVPRIYNLCSFQP